MAEGHTPPPLNQNQFGSVSSSATTVRSNGSSPSSSPKPRSPSTSPDPDSDSEDAKLLQHDNAQAAAPAKPTDWYDNGFIRFLRGYGRAWVDAYNEPNRLKQIGKFLLLSLALLSFLAGIAFLFSPGWQPAALAFVKFSAWLLLAAGAAELTAHAAVKMPPATALPLPPPAQPPKLDEVASKFLKEKQAIAQAEALKKQQAIEDEKKLKSEIPIFTFFEEKVINARKSKFAEVSSIRLEGQLQLFNILQGIDPTALKNAISKTLDAVFQAHNPGITPTETHSQAFSKVATIIANLALHAAASALHEICSRSSITIDDQFVKSLYTTINNLDFLQIAEELQQNDLRQAEAAIESISAQIQFQIMAPLFRQNTPQQPAPT